jgi:hypothetical protein
VRTAVDIDHLQSELGCVVKEQLNYHNSEFMKKIQYNYAIAQRAEWNFAVNQFMALFGGAIGRHKVKSHI